jgi:hypothetical protein
MKNRIAKSIVFGLVATVVGLASSTAAEARHWHPYYGGGYYGGNPYYGAYAAPAYGYGYGPGYYGGGYGWHHHHYWGGRGPIGASVRVW